MARVALVLIFLAILIAASLAVILALRYAATASHQIGDQPMPKVVSNIAYALLLILMIGVIFGWIGGL